MNCDASLSVSLSKAVTVKEPELIGKLSCTIYIFVSFPPVSMFSMLPSEIH